jgi:hypothetical protein
MQAELSRIWIGPPLHSWLKEQFDPQLLDFADQSLTAADIARRLHLAFITLAQELEPGSVAEVAAVIADHLHDYLLAIVADDAVATAAEAIANPMFSVLAGPHTAQPAHRAHQLPTAPNNVIEFDP